jgi:2-polyprenyl-6-methoxyphenol hydroxylase-like FAD-dependent oxidoreductase
VQVAILRKTGLADAVLRVATLDGESWVARFGRLIEKRPGDQHGILYDTMVNAMRGAIPPNVTFISAKVTEIATSAERQTVTLSTGEQISARLAIVANGLNVGLRDKLSMTREIISRTHSIMLGFDLAPAGRASFSFPALSYYGERVQDRAAYLTLFPVGAAMRANLSVYRDMDDLWLREFRKHPRETLRRLMPGLEKIIGAYDVTGTVHVRPADLYVTRGERQAGVVLVGDAFSTSCPGAGTGTGKVFTDVERLCNVYVPQWLRTPGMGAEKIAAFYDDPVRAAYHAHSIEKAFQLRALTVEPGLTWSVQRWLRFFARLGSGTLRKLRGGTPARPARAAPIGEKLGRAA